MSIPILSGNSGLVLKSLTLSGICILLTPWQTEVSIKERQKDTIKVQERQEKYVYRPEFFLIKCNHQSSCLVIDTQPFWKVVLSRLSKPTQFGQLQYTNLYPPSWVQDFTFTSVFQLKVLKMSSGGSD
jgi:hypothetical protein